MLGFGTLFFLADLLSSRLCSRLLSKCFVPLCVAALQAGRSWAKACHSPTGMLQALRVDFSTSLYCFLCPLFDSSHFLVHKHKLALCSFSCIDLFFLVIAWPWVFVMLFTCNVPLLQIRFCVVLSNSLLNVIS